jgi:hypothetical protein
MTSEQALIRYEALSKESKIRFLTYLSYEITVLLRGTYSNDHDVNSRISKLMGANELQHHISSELGHHIDDDLSRYPDDVFLRILTEKALHYGFSFELNHSLDRSFSKFVEPSNI